MWCLRAPSQPGLSRTNTAVFSLHLQKPGKDHPTGALRGKQQQPSSNLLAACSARSLKLPSAADLTSFPDGLHCNVRGTTALQPLNLPLPPPASVYPQPLLQLQTVRCYLTSGVKSLRWVKTSSEARPHLRPVLGTPELLVSLQRHQLRLMCIWDH